MVWVDGGRRSPGTAGAYARKKITFGKGIPHLLNNNNGSPACQSESFPDFFIKGITKKKEGRDNRRPEMRAAFFYFKRAVSR